jgi:hypothetical protein
LHTTHVNAAIALKSSTVLATLFHQGELIAINRATGDVQTMLHGLKRPHAVRWSGQIFTVADSGAGHGFTGTITRSGHFLETNRVNLNTAWLQDWHVLDDGLCVGVDGERPAVTFVTAQGAVIRRDKFDPSWHLYEIVLQ